MSISEAKANFAVMIAAVQNGEIISITRRGKEAAILRKPSRQTP